DADHDRGNWLRPYQDARTEPAHGGGRKLGATRRRRASMAGARAGLRRFVRRRPRRGRLVCALGARSWFRAVRDLPHHGRHRVAGVDRARFDLAGRISVARTPGSFPANIRREGLPGSAENAKRDARMWRTLPTALFCCLVFIGNSRAQDVFVPRELKAIPVKPSAAKEEPAKAEPASHSKEASAKESSAKTKVVKAEPVKAESEKAPSAKEPSSSEPSAKAKVAKVEPP